MFKGLRTGGSTQAQIINGVRDAWKQLFAIAARDLTQPTNYAAIEQLVDMDQFIDYSIGILYTADRDGPTGWLNGPPNSLEPKNFYATRRRTPDGRFRFWRWDSEFTLENVNEDVSERNGYENPGRLHYNLRVNPEYRLRFADRVQQLFFNNGPYTTAALTNRYLTLAGQIDKAVVAEAARWGDAKREPPFTRDVEWVAERNRIVNTYFPNRLNVFLSQLRTDRLFPSFAAPAFNINGVPQYGGQMAPGSLLSLTATNGQVYYTLDGTDPRLAGGAIAPGARLYGSPLTLPDSVVVKARVLSGSQWSTLSEATFFLPPDWSKLLVTEIMYNPYRRAESGRGRVRVSRIEERQLRSRWHWTDSSSHRAQLPLSPRRAACARTLLRAGPQCRTIPGEISRCRSWGRLHRPARQRRRHHPPRPSDGGTVLEVTYGKAVPWPSRRTASASHSCRATRTLIPIRTIPGTGGPARRRAVPPARTTRPASSRPSRSMKRSPPHPRRRWTPSSCSIPPPAPRTSAAGSSPTTTTCRRNTASRMAR